jgi:hypothetical protein
MSALSKRIGALERAHPSSVPRWHCIRHYEEESREDAIAAYEAENGPIGDDNVIMRIIITKSVKRPSASGESLSLLQ